jgi:AcrR family transcriptional regulator
MATAFTESEKVQIQKRLKEAAEECLGKYGVKKTTVDQLVKMAGISKGAFYQFSPSKELLFFKVLEDFQGSIMEFDTQENHSNIKPEALTEFLYGIYQKVRHSFLMNIIENGEMDLLMRKIPVEEITRHHTFDDLLAKKLFQKFNIEDNVEPRIVAASLRSIFLSMLHVKEIGEKEFDGALKMLIHGVALQLVGEDVPND